MCGYALLCVQKRHPKLPVSAKRLNIDQPLLTRRNLAPTTLLRVRRITTRFRPATLSPMRLHVDEPGRAARPGSLPPLQPPALLALGSRHVHAPRLTPLAKELLRDPPLVDPHAHDMLPHEALVTADHEAVVVLQLADAARDVDRRLGRWLFEGRGRLGGGGGGCRLVAWIMS